MTVLMKRADLDFKKKLEIGDLSSGNNLGFDGLRDDLGQYLVS